MDQHQLAVKTGTTPVSSNALLPAGYKQMQALPSASGTKKLPPSKPRKAITSAPKTKPAFVLKLWTMVNDPKNAAHIQWMPDGLSFQVVGREQFEKTVLPKYFKHSNFSSFVRQLNMYGWHKVQDVTAGAMQSGEETWQFKSPNFIRDREDLLDNIVRNKGSKGSDDEEEPDLHQILDEIETIRQSQQNISEDLKRIRQDNELLWRENYQTRERHQNFSDTLEKILRFLASVYGNPGKILGNSESIGSPVPASRNRLMLRDSADRSPILHLPAGSIPTVPNSASPSAIDDLFGIPSSSRLSNVPASDPITRRVSANSPEFTEPKLLSAEDTAINIPVYNSPMSSKSYSDSSSASASGTPISASGTVQKSAVSNCSSVPSTNSQVFDQSDLLDMTPTDQKSSTPSAVTAMSAPPSNMLSTRTVSPEVLNTVGSAGLHGPASNLLNPLLSDLVGTDGTFAGVKIDDSARSIEDLSHALDLQGESLEQVQEWLSKNIGVVDNAVPINTDGSTNGIEDQPWSSNSFDVGEFLASPGPGGFYEDGRLALSG